VKSDSEFSIKDALTAVVILRPFSRSNGASIEPQRTTKTRILKSLVVIFVSVYDVPSLDRILPHSGERLSPNRKTPATKYIIPSIAVGFTFFNSILFKVELAPNRIAETTASTYL
jgi:hypothetical protein